MSPSGYAADSTEVMQWEVTGQYLTSIPTDALLLAGAPGADPMRSINTTSAYRIADMAEQSSERMLFVSRAHKTAGNAAEPALIVSSDRAVIYWSHPYAG